MPEEARLGIVVPTLNEGLRLPALLDDLAALPFAHEVIVSDGGSTDGTRRAAREAGARVIDAPTGRARQLNHGARALSTPWLLFLHADCRLSPDVAPKLARWLDHATPDRAGYFRFALEGDDWFWRFIELGQGIRERLSGLAYGDQGLLVSRRLYERAGGYPDVPLMEDVALLRTLKELGSVERLEATLFTSPRRYEQDGRWRGWLRNSALIGLYLAGTPPEKLARWYRPQERDDPAGPRTGRTAAHGDHARALDPRSSGAGPPEAGDPAGPRRTLLVFAKNPEPGRVKTRIARSLGADRAAELYRELGRTVVDQVRGGPYRTVVCYDPPDALDQVRSWLGPRDVEFRPQAAGDLGERMSEAFRWAFQDADQVCIVGTDAPDVNEARISGAFRALDDAPLVLGPAEDGGYYLMGLTRTRETLFHGIPWSTDQVLSATLDQAEKLGLEPVLLPTLADVDTPTDIPAELA